MRTRTVLVSTALFVAWLASPTLAAAQEIWPPVTSPAVTPWEVRAGYRGSFVESAGYEPFSSNDYFPQGMLGASRVLWHRRRFAVSVGAAWDYGNTGAAARGGGTSLEMHRITAPITLRYAFLRRLEAFVAVAPGAAHQSVGVDEASAPARLVASSWLPCGDASVGARWAFGDTRIGSVPFVFWLTAEAGYAATAPMTLALSPDLPQGDPRQTGATDLGSLAMSGGFGRIGLAVGF